MGVTVCRKILEKGFQVRVFDLDTPRNRKSVRELGDEAEVVWGDITSQECVRQAADGIDAVVHMAGILPPVSEERPELAKRVNVEGTRVLVDILREREKRVPLLFTSSVAVFGPTPDTSRPISVEQDLPRPDCSYGQTKLQAEQMGVSFFYVLMMVSFATAVFLAAEIIYSNDSFQIPDSQSFLALAALGLLSQSVGWILITNALPNIRASLSGLILLLEPALAFVWDVLFFQRPTSLVNWLGVVIALGAIYLGMGRRSADTDAASGTVLTHRGSS